jgi:hypothetical protein
MAEIPETQFSTNGGQSYTTVNVVGQLTQTIVGNNGGASLTNVIIGTNVTSIGTLAFLGLSNLTSVIIPNSVTSMNANAFRNCSKLLSIIIPNSITAIPPEAFRGCSGLTSIIMLNIGLIDNAAFHSCTSLASVTITNSVGAIRNNAFENNFALSNITFLGGYSSSKFFGTDVFKNIPTNSTREIIFYNTSSSDDINETLLTQILAITDNDNISETGPQIFIKKKYQTITFNPLPSQQYSLGSEITLTETSSSGLSITYTSSDTDVVTVNGNTLLIQGVGTSTITASQSGNDEYEPATNVTQDQEITKANQTITFNPLPSQQYSLGGVISLTATSDSGLPISYTSSDDSVVTVDGDTLIIQGVGTATITASQSGNSEYEPATNVTQDQEITKANQTITFNPLPSQQYSLGSEITLTATSDSGLSITYTSSDDSVVTVDGDTLIIQGVGTSTITASQSGNSEYNPATSVTQDQEITKATPELSNFSFNNKYITSSPFRITAPTSTSNGVFSYTSSNPSVAKIFGDIITIKGYGNAIITATQSSTANYTSNTISNNLYVSPDKVSTPLIQTLAGVSQSKK